MFSQTEVIDDDKKLISAVDLYFIQDDGGRFRVSSVYSSVYYVFRKSVSQSINQAVEWHLILLHIQMVG